MLHASRSGSSVLGNFNQAGCKQHGLRGLRHPAVGCQAGPAEYGHIETSETSSQSRGQKHEEHVSVFSALISSTVCDSPWKYNIVVVSRMKMLQEEYDSMSEDQKSQVEKWEKEQIAQNYFNCTRRPSSDPRSGEA